VLYILIALVLTGMENYASFKGISDPLAFVFENRAPWIENIVSISAVVATTSVLLVFQIGQPRIWMSMSRDGLLPQRFGKINTRYQTPGFATVLTGVIVGVGALFLQSGLVTDLTSIGTLFAFVLVSGGVLLLPSIQKAPGQFSLPYINGRFWIPVLVLLFFYLTSDRLVSAFSNILNEGYQEILFVGYFVAAVVLAVFSFFKNWSLIPVLGMLSCMYLMIEIPAISWSWFFAWMGFGLLLYFSYGYRNSKLRNNK